MRITNFKEDTLREVIKSILVRDLKNIKNKKVLEIGCGNWDFAKKIVEGNGCRWYGFEPVDLGKDNLTIVKGSVKNIPYHSNSFDVVLCNQTIEHWFEYGVSFKKALNEINRVLKPNGLLMINAPIHLHGHPIFLRGDLKRIKRLFKERSWKMKLFEKCFSSKNVKRWKKLGEKGWQSKVGYPDILIPNYKKVFSYVINIHVIKRPILKKKKKKVLFRELNVILRFIKEYLMIKFLFK